MIILYENALNDSVMSASASSVNYPIESVIHRYKKKRWQCLSSNSVITCIFNSVKTLNCIFYSYHTLNTFSFQLFDSTNTLIYSGSDTNIKDIGISYFDKIDNVKKIVFTVSAIDTLRIGTLWTGEYVKYNNFLSTYDISYDDNTVEKESGDFQISGLYTEPAMKFDFTIPELNESQKQLIVNEYIKRSKIMPFFVDIFELNRSKQEPKYMRFDGTPDIKKNGRMFNVSLKFKEAR